MEKDKITKIYTPTCQKYPGKHFLQQLSRNNSISSDHILMKYSLLESSYQGKSNGGIFMSLALIDEKLFAYYYLRTFSDNFSSNYARDI